MDKMPNRVQLRRTRGWHLPPNTRSVARPTKWGNPYCLSEWSPLAAVRLYERDLREGKLRVDVSDVRRELRGCNLACWCSPGERCHADLLLEIANTPEVDRD